MVSFCLLSLFTRGRWVVKKGQNSVYVVIEYRNTENEEEKSVILVSNFLSINFCSPFLLHCRFGKRDTPEPELTNYQEMLDADGALSRLSRPR